MNTASSPDGNADATGSSLTMTLGDRLASSFMCANASGWALTTSAVSTAYTFPEGPTACASDAVRRPATISATLSPFLSPINWTTSGAFQAGSSAGAADCENALVAAPIEIASVKNDPSFRMCKSFYVVLLRTPISWIVAQF